MRYASNNKTCVLSFQILSQVNQETETDFDDKLDKITSLTLCEIKFKSFVI